MKKALTLLLIFLSVSLYSKDNSILDGYDNLLISVSSVKNTNYKVERDEYGIYTLNFKEKKNSFDFLLTLYPVQQKELKMEDLKNSLENRGKELLYQAEETRIVINEIKSDSGVTGYYYILTDKNPAPKEYKYLVQGYVKYNHLAGYFTFLYNKKDDINLFNKISIETLVDDKIQMKQTGNFEKIKLTANDISDYDLSFTKHFYCQQQVNFYNDTATYGAILPKVEEKYTQSISTGKEEGTVFFYYFKNKLSSAHEGFIKGLFYGTPDKPTKDHPELIIVKDNYLIVLSFPYNSSTAKKLKEIIEKRLDE